MTKSQELAKKEFEARARFGAIHKMATPSDAEMKEATELVASIKTLSEQRVAAQQTEKSIADNEAAMKELKEAPTSSMIFAGPDGQKLSAAFVEDGATGVEKRGEEKGAPDLSVVYEEGGLGLSQKQIEAISTKDYKHAFKHYLRSKRESEMTGAEMKTLQEGSDAAGGFLVPDDIQSRVIQKAPTPTRVAGMVTRLQTSRDAMVFPKVNYSTDDIYTTGIRVKWTGEVPSSATTHRVTDPQFAQIRIPIHTAMLSMPITNDMIEDSAFPIVQWSADKFRETVDLLYDNVILNGSGIGQPAGILINPAGDVDQPGVVNSGAAAVVTADGLFDLTYSVPEQYEDNLSFIFNKTQTGKMIAKLKDDNKRYLFARGITDDGLSMGRPTSLLGYGFAYSAFMPNPGANTFPIVFGDPRGYYFVERIGFSIQVLREIYAETNQQLLLGRLRIGGQTAEPWRMKIGKCAV